MIKKIIPLCLLCFVFNTLHAQKKVRAIADQYLAQKNIQNIELLDSIAGNYKIFFTGENHDYTEDNSLIELSMLAYLHKRAGVRNLIIELGFSRGYMIDQYINNDTSYIDNLRKSTDIGYIKFYEQLRALNQKLDSGKKIHVHGVDVERFPDDAPVLLSRLIPANKPIPDAIGITLEALRSYSYYNSVKYANYYGDDRNSYYYDGYGFNDTKSMDTLISDYINHRPAFITLLGDSFTLFDHIFSSLIEYRKWQNYGNTPYQEIYRERKIFENISNLIKKDTAAKFYGQFGRCHTAKTIINSECQWYAFNSTARRLNEEIAKGKTLTIGIFYSDHYLRGHYEDHNTSAELEKYLDPPCNNQNVLTKVADTDSLLSKHFDFILYNNICKDVRAAITSSDYAGIYNYYSNYSNSIDFGVGYSYFNFNNLNKGLQLTDKKFGNSFTTLHFGITTNEDKFHNAYRFNALLSQSIQQGNNRYKLKGYSLEEGIGYTPEMGERFSMSFYAVLAFQRLSLLAENDSSKLMVNKGFGPLTSYKYINNSCSVGAGVDMRWMVFREVGVFASARYLEDLSKKYWQQSRSGKNALDKNSPLTSLTNYSIIVGICFKVD